MDSAAEFIVTVGGFVVLCAVLGICIYLAWVVVPLFVGGKSDMVGTGKVPFQAPEHVVLDPYGNAVGMFDHDGSVQTFLLGSGAVVGEHDLRSGDDEPSAVQVVRNGELVAVGFPDGTVRLGEIGFRAALLPTSDEPDEARDELIEIEHGYIEHLHDGQRQMTIEIKLGDSLELSKGDGGVRLIDYRVDPTGKKTLVALRDDNTVLVNSVRTIRPLGGGEPRIKLRSNDFVLDGKTDAPDWMYATGDGQHVLFIWSDGHLDRYSKSGSGFGLVERVQIVDPGVRVTATTMLLGARTLMIADDQGGVSAFHVADDRFRTHEDNRRLVRAHHIRNSESPVVDIYASTRDRLIAVLHEDGYVDLLHESSEKLVSRFKPGIESPAAVMITPKNDGVIVYGQNGEYARYAIELGYPEFSARAVFGRVHYEGAEEPEFVYQSSSGDDASEIKFSLVPLIYGTLKATVFAMLFAVPIAVLAAIYSSEFLGKGVRRVVKPSVELMASLPSVVLGFIAAIVVAPYVQEHLAGFVFAILILPLSILIAAHLWQMVPISARRRLRSGQHFLLVMGALLIGAGVSAWAGPSLIGNWVVPDRFDAGMIAGEYRVVPEDRIPAWAESGVLTERQERRLRVMGMALIDGALVEPIGEVDRDAVLAEVGLQDGDLQRWLNGEYGAAWPGWAIALFPVVATLVWLVQGIALRRPMDTWLAGREPLFVAIMVFVKLIVMCVLSLVISVLVARLLGGMGIDPRDSIFGTFSPRNTLVVAVVMGFAVIPIIYTISEDALQAVPNTLRSASLGAGATPWQTAVRVVLPVAGSGIFSACMIGFGRAVGETMIVLMATGNTPEMSPNIFSGFRTLAANIAVEIPEAPKDQTHYRVLFLCGLVLFVMTFFINTLAEIVRRVVRSRNAGL